MSQNHSRITELQQNNAENAQKIFPMNPIYILPKHATPLNTPISGNSEQLRHLYIRQKPSYRGSDISNVELFKLNQQLTYYKKIAGQMQNQKIQQSIRKDDRNIPNKGQNDIIEAIKNINEKHLCEIKSAEHKKAKNEFQKMLFKKQIESIEKQKQELLKATLNEQYKSSTLSQELNKLNKKYLLLKSSKQSQITSLKNQLSKSKIKVQQLQTLNRELKYLTNNIPIYEEKIEYTESLIQKLGNELNIKENDLKGSRQKIIKLQQKTKDIFELNRILQLEKNNFQNQMKDKIKIIQQAEINYNTKSNQFQKIKAEFINLYNTYVYQAQLKNKDIYYLSEEINSKNNKLQENNHLHLQLAGKIDFFAHNQKKIEETCLFLAQEAERLKQAINKLEEKLHAEKQEKKMLQIKIEELLEQISDSKELMLHYEDQIRKRQAKIQQILVIVEIKAEQQNSYIDNINDLNEYIKELSDKKAQVEKQRQQLQQKMQKSSKSLDQYVQQISKKQSKIESIKRQVQKAKSDIKQLKDCLQSKELVLKQKQTQISRLRHELSQRNAYIEKSLLKINELLSENTKERLSNGQRQIKMQEQTRTKVLQLNRQMQNTQSILLSQLKQRQDQLRQQQQNTKISFFQEFQKITYEFTVKINEKICQNGQLIRDIQQLKEEREQLSKFMNIKSKQVIELNRRIIANDEQFTEKYKIQMKIVQEKHKKQVTELNSEIQIANQEINAYKHQVLNLISQIQTLKVQNQQSIKQLTAKLHEKANHNEELVKHIEQLTLERQNLSKFVQIKQKQVMEMKKKVIDVEMHLTGFYTEQIFKMQEKHKQHLKKMQSSVQKETTENLSSKEIAKRSETALKQEIINLMSMLELEQTQKAKISHELTSKLHSSIGETQQIAKEIQKLKEQRENMAKMMDNKTKMIILLKQQIINSQNELSERYLQRSNSLKAKHLEQITQLSSDLSIKESKISEEKAKTQNIQRMTSLQKAKMKKECEQAIERYKHAIIQKQRIINQQAKEINQLSSTLHYNNSTLTNTIQSQKKVISSLNDQNTKKLKQIYYHININKQNSQRIRFLQLQKGSLAQTYNQLIFQFQNIKKLVNSLIIQRDNLINHYIEMNSHLDQIKQDPLQRTYLKMLAETLNKVTVIQTQISRQLLNVNRHLNHMLSTFNEEKGSKQLH